MKISKALTGLTVALAMFSGAAAHAKALTAKTINIEQGSIKIDGYIYKDNNTSNMQVALRAIGQDSGVNVGYGILGNAIVGPNKGEGTKLKVDVDFTDMECNKVGATPSAAQTDEYTTASSFDKDVSLQMMQHSGKLVVTGEKNATTGAVEGNRTTISAEGDWSTFVGVKIKGSYAQKSTGSQRSYLAWAGKALGGSNSNALQFANLEVNNVKSSGQLNYVYGQTEKDPSGYFASKDAKFGNYQIATGNIVADAPVISYKTDTDSFQFDLDFGGFLVTGTVMFVSNGQAPKLDKSTFFNVTKPLDVVTGAPGAGAADKAATTTGNFSLTVKRKGGGSIQISKNLAKEAGSKESPDEVQLRSLLAFILTTAYDTFGN